jgi:SEC-C motif-containing protein
MSMPAPSMPPGGACPCGSSAAYEHCCGRWHGPGSDHLLAPDALALMRSRYCAYVLDLRPYLLATWHPSTRPPQITDPTPGLRWLGLEVRRHVVIDGDHARVEYVARSKLGGRADRLHALSRFERVDGRWFYVDDAERR